MPNTDWELFLYRLPSEPSRARVAVWRELRRLGALPLGQSVVVSPVVERFTEALTRIEERVTEESGSSYRFRLDSLAADVSARLTTEWNELRTHEYAEIVEECETKFLKEIEFELFRGNLTASEAEEIEADLDKLKRWIDRIRDRDLFAAPGRREAEKAIAGCERALDDFVERVFQAESRSGPITDQPLDIAWGDMPDAPSGPARIVEHPGRKRPTPKPKTDDKKGRKQA